ncbi:MAG TPA: CHAT domain-containing protein [Planctomycetota bacterium]
MLAVSTVLAALARERAAELEELVRVLDERAASGPELEADLALALAQGWLALRAVPRWGELAGEERCELLGRALDAATAIEPADRRDAFGCSLAAALHEELRALGHETQATARLEAELARFPEDDEQRPLLLCYVADERLVRGELGAAWGGVRVAEEALAGLPAKHPSRAVFERTLASVRGKLELASGLVDQAWLSLDRQRAAGAGDLESRFGLLLDAAAVGLAQTQPGPLQDILEELDEALDVDGPFAGPSAWRAQLRARRALLEDHLERLDPGAESGAGARLAEALADEDLDELHRSVLLLRRVERHARAREWDAAGARLAEVGTGTAASPVEIQHEVVAWRALLALETGASEAELRARFDEVRAQHQVFLRSWRDAPQRAGGLGVFYGRGRQLLLGAAIRLALALEGETRGAETGFALVLETQALGSLARHLEAGPGSLAEVRARLLGEGSGLLTYVSGGPDELHVFALDAGTIRHARVAWRVALEEAPRLLRAELETSPALLSERERRAARGRIEGLARTLGQRLLPEELHAQLARWSAVYVAGADIVGGVPFELLPVPRSAQPGETLGMRLALATLPSVPVGLALAQRRPSAAVAPGLLLVGAPELGPGSSLAPIPVSPDVLAALTEGFARRSTLLGKEATWDGLVAELGRSPTLLLHLLVHGESDLERELTAGLALPRRPGAPELVWCEDVLAGAVRYPPLVLLSTCGAARGPRRPGDDGLGQLAGAFLAGGALAVVHAAGDLAFEPTVRLVAAFQRELLAGASPAEALRRARVELGRDARFAEPFYLYAPSLVGLGLESLVTPRR